LVNTRHTWQIYYVCLATHNQTKCNFVKVLRNYGIAKYDVVRARLGLGMKMEMGLQMGLGSSSFIVASGSA